MTGPGSNLSGASSSDKRGPWRIPDRSAIVHGVLVVFAMALIGRAGYVQVYKHAYWADKGARQQYLSSSLPAPRGDIRDESGVTLVESRELVHVGVAPREVRQPVALARALKNARIDPKWVRAAVDTTRVWVDIPGLFMPVDVAPAVAMRGVYAKPVMDRVYANSSGIRRIVGRVDPATGRPLDGIEAALDTMLKGDTGRVRMARDRNGHVLDASVEDNARQPGKTVVLTINQGLQDICERALSDAVDSLHATGGDIVVMNPHTGDVLAMASKRTDPTAVANTAITEPYEPGSTVKPFVAAALIGAGRAKPDEIINTYGGHFELDGRKINDAEEHEAMMTLSDVIKHSSNVGIVRFAQRFTPREKYELLRNLGFGTPTLVPLPAESPGALKPVRFWSKQTQTSMMMGYELSVTPLQIVTAYSAIANGGLLLEPHLIRSVTTPAGDTVYASHTRVLRRVMRPDVATVMQKMLRDVVSGGTSTKADLATLDVAGKSGTARRAVKGRYEAGAYTASFVGLFPQDNPQFVILVKLDRPQNGYYGGVVAGGVTNVVLRAALAARDASLDLHELASSVHAPRPDTTAEGRAAERAKARADSIRLAAPPKRVAVVQPDTDPRTSASYVIKLPASTRVAPVAATPRPVPDVSGLPLRVAARTLHAAGFRVQIVHGGATPPNTSPTVPAAGTPLLPGRVVKLSSEP